MIRPILSIIIISYNTADITSNCLKSVMADKGLTFDLSGPDNTNSIPTEIVVIDNASTDDSIAKINKFKVKLICNKKNLGFAKANNQGFKIAQGNYVLLLNSDTVILHSAISQALIWLSAHPEAGICTGQLLNKDGSIQPTGGYFPSLLNTLTWSIGLDDLPLVNLFIPPIHPHPPQFYTRDNFYLKDRQLDWVTGAFMLIRKELIDKTNGFDPNYFMYAEELEWSYRIKKTFPRLQTWYLIGPQIIHLGGASSQNNTNKLLLEYCGIYNFFIKHKPKSSRLAKILLQAGAYLRSLVNPNYKNLWQKI